jgi:hypothetical protein
MKKYHKVVDLHTSYAQTKYFLSEADKKWDDKWNNYEVNSLKMRSPEIKDCADIVISGCSFSYGIGVPENMSWGVQVANELELKYHNISSPGKGVLHLVNNLFSYFKLYGNPKVVICLFPEPLRMQITASSDHMISKRFLIPGSVNYMIHENGELQNFGVTLNQSYEEYPQFSKRPHAAEDVMPIELAFDLSFQAIKFLEMYCKEAGIKLVWSFWDIWTELKLATLDNDYEFFIDTDQRSWHSQKKDGFYDRLHPGVGESCDTETPCTEFVDCHKEFKEIYGENWDISSDVNDEGFLHHWGIHRHKHIAEAFLKEIKNGLD